MSTQNTPSTSTTSSTRWLLSSPAVRYALVGFVMLAVALTHLITVVQNWSAAADPMTFAADHIWQLAGILVGLALIVTAVVKSHRS